MYELQETGSYSTDYRSAPRMSLVNNWGDVYQGHRISFDAQGNPMQLGYLIPAGLYWNEATQLLYWTYYDSYNLGRPARLEPGCHAVGRGDRGKNCVRSVENGRH